MGSHLICCVCGIKSKKTSDHGNIVQRGVDVGFFGTMNSECVDYYFCPACMAKMEPHLDVLSQMLTNLKYPHFSSLVQTMKAYQVRRDTK